MFVDTSILPSDIFNYHDYEFYSIVSQLTGSDEVELLRIQNLFYFEQQHLCDKIRHTKNGRDLNLLDLKLTEGTDYLLTVPSYNSDSAHIRCGCRASARLPRQGNNFQLSNYYRHLKTGKCSMLQSKFQSNPAQDNDTHDVSNDTIKKLSSDQTMIMEDTQLLSIDSNSTIRSKRTTTSSNHVHSKKKRQRKFM
ncbi:unnamed protein product [Rotaria magnacalcarata]|uniref:Uncharacterized protein n=1 Tax=Rotaria magnacalcarata TaxID=392030 RepID=A0A815LC41_9BILA|nr:unnamed protein product [Rotaria magnacalcarata]CAF3838645.1 unnamed protein product [Rotaria magnacalcarata]